MKSAVVASALFASLAFAAPLNKRVLSTKTHTVIETVIVYTTVWDNQPVAEATSTQALFFENKPSSSSSSVVSTSSSSSSSVVVEPTPEPTPEPAPSTPPVQAPSSTSQAPPPQEPSPSPKPSPTPTPAPAPAPKPSPEPTPEPAPQPKPSPSPQPQPEPQPQPSQPSGGSGGGESHSGSLTMNYYGGGLGACGEPVSDSEMAAALAVEGFGDSTYDVATGNPTNKWCGKKIRITYNGKSADAKIMDRCPGCTGSGGLDATPALWEALTGGIGGASGDRLNTGMSWTVIG